MAGIDMVMAKPSPTTEASMRPSMAVRSPPEPDATIDHDHHPEPPDIVGRDPAA
jgi:hypothetical protein